MGIIEDTGIGEGLELKPLPTTTELNLYEEFAIGETATELTTGVKDMRLKFLRKELKTMW